MQQDIIEILSSFKHWLEEKFKFEKSVLIKLKPSMLGQTGVNLNFESNVSIDIYYWEHGIVDIASMYFTSKSREVKLENTRELLYFIYTPDNYQNKSYPNESKDVLINKLNELSVLIEQNGL